MKIKAIIVDDEEQGRETLKELLAQYCPKVEFVGEADSTVNGLNLIDATKPDLVFLDIEMPEADGFDLIKNKGDRKFEVIFITAFQQYAIKAFNYSVVGYLLKPIHILRLQAAVDKAVKILSLKEEGKKRITFIGRLALPTLQGYEFVDIDKICTCKADGSYTVIHFIDNSTKMVSKPLGEIEEILDDFHFFRVHNSFIINLKQIDKYVKGRGGHVVMTNGQVIGVASRKKEAFINIFNNTAT